MTPTFTSNFAHVWINTRDAVRVWNSLSKTEYLELTTGRPVAMVDKLSLSTIVSLHQDGSVVLWPFT